MKRMLEKDQDGSWVINASSMDIIQTCRRKALYALERNLRREDESESLTFGKAIHAGLEVFYRTPIIKRSSQDVVDAFMATGRELAHIPEGEKRSLSNGRKILERYCALYMEDPWQIYHDDEGPMVERTFEEKFGNFKVHGQIDCVLQNSETGELVVCDHKTTSTVTDLLRRVKPNMQFSLYVWAMKKRGLPISRAMVNGIQVAKTKSDFLRVFTERTTNDLIELGQALKDSLFLYQRCLEEGVWPMNSASCSNWGGCQYQEICAIDAEFRENAIQQIYKN